MKVLVVGTGSVGLRHIKNLKEIGVDVYYYSYTRKALLDYCVQAVVSLDYETLRKFDAVVIASETNKHLEVAKLCVESMIPFYIEKPISNNMNGVRKLLKQIKDKKIITKVGYMLRTHPNLLFIKDFLNSMAAQLDLMYVDMFVGQWIGDWRPGTNYKSCYSASVKRGGGVILDLIHELDIVSWLLGDVDSIFCFKQNIEFVEIETEAVAEIILLTKRSKYVRVHMDYLYPVYKREMLFVFREYVLSWDYQSGTVTKTEKSGLKTILNKVSESFERNNMFVNLMSEFIEDLKQERFKNSCNFEDGVTSLTFACSAHESGKDGKWVKI